MDQEDDDDLGWMDERTRSIYEALSGAAARNYAEKAWVRRCTELGEHRVAIE